MKEGRDMSAELVAEAVETTPAVILRRRRLCWRMRNLHLLLKCLLSRLRLQGWSRGLSRCSKLQKVQQHITRTWGRG